MTQSKKLKVGILGATGAVGEQMRIVLAERKFPIEELRLFGSLRSAGRQIEFCGEMLTVQEASQEAFAGLDLLLGAADNDVAKVYLPAAAASGITVVDNSSAFRLDPAVPLVIPEVNPDDALTGAKLIANPNCATIIALTTVAGQFHTFRKTVRFLPSCRNPHRLRYPVPGAPVWKTLKAK